VTMAFDSMHRAPPSAPEICTGRVMHQRLRPHPHRFSYPVFFLRVPLSALDALPNRWFSHDRFNLLSFVTADYGPRDGSDLEAWARMRLATAGYGGADGEIVLQAFPRVLGYVFNPISLWYCHDRSGALRAVIAEVSNTFGERHDYVLAADDGGVIGSGRWLTADKRLHLSPFCEVRGRYRFRFDQHARGATARIDYFDSPGAADPLLVTAISGTPAPLDQRSALGAFLRHPLFTFGVIARIHWQAVRLWGKRVPWFRKAAPSTLETTQ